MLKKKYHGGGEDDEEEEATEPPSYEPGYDVGSPEDESGDEAKGAETAEAVTEPPPSVVEPPAPPAAATTSLDSEAKSKLSATFNSMEYSEAEVPNIIPKGTEKVQRRSFVEGGGGDGDSHLSPRYTKVTTISLQLKWLYQIRIGFLGVFSASEF